jgi:MerR family transcriptional regulator, redox-sensitive transcriptional activator SoxR
LKPQRNRAIQRRYTHSNIRRVSIVTIAQKCGFRLRDIKKLLAPLSQNRSPTSAEWALVSQVMRSELNRKILQATILQDQLKSCIGCGYLSMNACYLFNTQVHLAKQGARPMRLTIQATPIPVSNSD